MSDQDIVASIEALDERRVRAILAKDFDTVAQLIGDDLKYVHSSAVQEDKALYLERLRNGHYNYRALNVIERGFRVFGDVVLVNGDILIDVEVGTITKSLTSRFLQVWARRAGNWQMVSWHSTTVPG